MLRQYIVLDASMAIAWVFEDEHTPAVLGALARVVDDGALVPSLWRLEVANTLRSATRRRRCDLDFAGKAFAILGRLDVRIDAETDRHAWGETWRLSREYDLTSYDAAYLELALRRRLALATTDKALRNAASRCNLEVIG